MDAKRALPYVIGLAVLAFALGSLQRAGSGESILFESTWLLYLYYLGPIVILVVMAAIIAFIGYYWRDIGEAIGFARAKKRLGKKRSRWSLLVFVTLWALAIGVLITLHKGPFALNSMNDTAIIKNIVGDNSPPPNPLKGGFAQVISGIVQNNWFGWSVLGLFAVGGLVLFQSMRVALRTTSELRLEEHKERNLQGLNAVNDAIKLVDEEGSDPRSRIIACYERLISTVSRLGAPISPDQTPRELERAIRTTLLLRGPATGDLTWLFEEARYSIHEIEESDASNAHRYLDSISDELKLQLSP